MGFFFQCLPSAPARTAPSPDHCHSKRRILSFRTTYSVILNEVKNLEPNAETDIKNRKNITERKNHISKQKILAAGYCLKLDVAVPWPKKPGIWER